MVGGTEVALIVDGRHDRPFPPDKPVIGLVRPVGIRNMKRRFASEAFIRDIGERWPG